MRSSDFQYLRKVCGLFGAGLRRLGQLFQPQPPAARRRNRLADLMPLEDRRLPSAVPIGVPSAGEFRVNTFTHGQQTLSAQTRQAVALDAAGDFVVVWASQDQDGDGWGVYAQRYDALDNRQGGEFRVNSTTRDDQDNPAVSMDAAGNFVVVWQSQSQGGQGNGWDIHAQRYNAAGVAQGGEFRVNSTTDDDQLNPTVAVGPSGGFLVAWQSQDQDGNGWGVYAQRYSAAGVAQGGEFRVNTLSAHNQQDPAVAVDGRGDYLVAWQGQSQGGPGTGWNIYAHRYDASGNALGGEFLVNTTTAGNQQAPAVAADATGDFVIAWQGQSQGGHGPGHGHTGWDVFAQRVNPAGTMVGGQFQVNTTTAQDQVTPAVALDSNGDSVITWASQGQGKGGSWGIFGQLYDAAGNRAGSEFLVNTTTQGDQQNPSAALDSRGDLVVAWSGNGVGDSNGVFAHHFLVTGISANIPVGLGPPPGVTITLDPGSEDTPLGTVDTPTLTSPSADGSISQTVTIPGVASTPAPGFGAHGVSRDGGAPGSSFVLSVTDLAQVQQMNPAAPPSTAPPAQWVTLPAGADASAAASLGGGRNLGMPSPNAAIPVPYDVSAVNVLAGARLGLPATTLTALPPDSPGAQDPALAGRSWTGPTLLVVRPTDAPSPVHIERPSFAMSLRSLESSLLATGASADGGSEETAGAASTVARGESVFRSRQVHGLLPWDAAERREEPAEMGESTDGPGPVALTGLAATAGYVLLHTRAAPWLLSLLVAKPLWKQLDPLEVLFAWEHRDDRGESGEEETLLSLVE